jgi:peroxiredoxin
MKLNTATTAPSFQAENMSGQMISLQDYKDRNLLVKFYRFANCPVCNLHLRNFVRKYDKLQNEGLSVLAIYHSPQWRTYKTLSHDLPFEILADPDKRIFRSYGVGSSLAGMFSWSVWRDYALAMMAGYSSGMLSHDGGITGHPADFIIGKNGKILYAHYGKDYVDSLSVDQVINVARELRLNDAGMNPRFTGAKIA